MLEELYFSILNWLKRTPPKPGEESEVIETKSIIIFFTVLFLIFGLLIFLLI